MVFPAAPLRTALASLPRSIALCCGGGGAPHNRRPPAVLATATSSDGTFIFFLAASSCPTNTRTVRQAEKVDPHHRAAMRNMIEAQTQFTLKQLNVACTAEYWALVTQFTFARARASEAAWRLRLDSSSNQAKTSRLSSPDGEASPFSITSACT